jgi:hypothetical protein
MTAVQGSAHKPLIMMIGMGDLSRRLLTMLLANPATNRLVLAGRNPNAIWPQANLAKFTAMNLGLIGSVQVEKVDLRNVSATAETIARVRPDIIFMGASLQSWRVITELPRDVFERLDQAQYGPWLPMHLTLNHLLMRAVRMSNTSPSVVNAAYPDVVGPVLAKVGLAPDTGIGNVANVVPALTLAFAGIAGIDPADIELRLVAQHYFSHYVPRFGAVGNGSYRLTVSARGERIDSRVDHAAAFGLLTGRLKRVGGLDGQLLTASSAMRVLAALAESVVYERETLAHAPGPGGLPGGYPVRIGRNGITVDLDPVVSLDDAIRVNEECQRADGIDNIGEDATVTFSEPEMAIMTDLLGYECRAMKLEESSEWADELGHRYESFAMRHGAGGCCAC